MLFNRDTFNPDVEVKFSYRHDTRDDASLACLLLFRDPFSFRCSCLITYHMAPCANVSCQKKKRDDATIISYTGSRRFSAFRSSSKLTAASRVPTVFGSLGNCLWKQWRDYESVDSRKGILETGANVDRESVVPTIFSSQSKGRRDRDQNVVHSLRVREVSKKPLNGKLTRPSEEREWLSKECMKLRLKLRQKIGRGEILTIKNSNLNDFSYIKQVDGKKIMQEIANKLKN